MTENDKIVAMIINLRREKKITQEEMALRLNMKQPNYRRLESGKHEIRYVTLLKILDILGIIVKFEPKEILP